MSAREIAFTQIRRMSEAGESHQMGARWVLEALTAAGYRIVGPDEVDPVSIEKAAQIADILSSPTADTIAQRIRAIASGGKQ